MKPIIHQAIFSISATILVSLLYFLIMKRLKGNNRAYREEANQALFLMKKVLGFLLLGIVPAVIAWWFFRFSPMQAGLHWKDAGSVWILTVGASVFFILLNLINSRNKDIR
ncbi:MAG: hypothetical protein R3339_07515, partial [Thermodesulfobacteriota bacterium]|nr:hypothetical protein [Thermodesulfobacteriota bacterium]